MGERTFLIYRSKKIGTDNFVLNCDIYQNHQRIECFTDSYNKGNLEAFVKFFSFDPVHHLNSSDAVQTIKESKSCKERGVEFYKLAEEEVNKFYLLMKGII